MRLASPIHLRDMGREDPERSAEGSFALLTPVEVAVKLETAIAQMGVESRRSDAAPKPVRHQLQRTLPELTQLSIWFDQPDVEARWRVRGWISGGSRTLFAAPSKAGKTTITGNLIRSMADGVPFLGDEEATVTPLAEGETIVLLDFEMAPRQMKDWLRKQAITRTDAVYVAPMRGHASTFNIMVTACRQEWARTLKAVNCKILGLDCLRPILDALMLDERSDVGQFLVALDQLLDEAEIDVCWLVHHWGHEKKRPRGDSRLRDWPDAEISLTREGERFDSPRFISARGRDVDQPKRALVYDEETRHVTLADGGRHQQPDNTTEARERPTTDIVLGKAVAVLTDEPGLNARQITEKIRQHSTHSKTTIANALSQGCVTRILRAEGPANNRRYFLNVSEEPKA